MQTKKGGSTPAPTTSTVLLNFTRYQPPPPPTPTEALALLTKPEFQRDAHAYLEALERAKASYKALSGEAREAELDRFLGRHAQPFREKWHVFPPDTSELLFGPEVTKKVAAILTGRWALIPIFPWTRESEVVRAVRRVRQSLGLRHADAQSRHRAALADWLQLQNPPYPPQDIFRAVWGRKPPRGTHMTDKQMRTAMRTLQAEGLSYLEADRRMTKRDRKRTGKQRMLATMRTAKARYAQLLEEEARDTDLPTVADSLSHAITRLLRDTFCQDTVTTHALLAHIKAIRAALLPRAASRVTETH